MTPGEFFTSQGYRPYTLEEADIILRTHPQIKPDDATVMLDMLRAREEKQSLKGIDNAPELGSPEFYTLIAPAWSLFFGRFSDVDSALLTATEQEIRSLDLPPGSYILDTGCGIGLHTLYLAQAFPNLTFIAYDSCHAVVEEMNRQVEVLKLNNITLMVGDHEMLPAIGLDPPKVVLAFRSYFEVPLPCCTEMHHDPHIQPHLSELSGRVESLTWLVANGALIMVGTALNSYQYEILGGAMEMHGVTPGHFAQFPSSHSWAVPHTHPGDPVEMSLTTWLVP